MSKPIIRLNKFWFYFLNLTWGLLVTLVGSIIALVMLITNHTPYRHGGCIYFEVGKPGWGGFEMGLFFFCSPGASTHTKNHEFGHGIQTAAFGIFMWPIISIPSFLRYWLRECKTIQKKKRYILIVYLILLLIGLLTILIPILTNLTYLLIIPFICIIYANTIFSWLINSELPKYENNKYVPYDEIWFEGSATELGTYYIEKW